MRLLTGLATGHESQPLSGRTNEPHCHYHTIIIRNAILCAHCQVENGRTSPGRKLEMRGTGRKVVVVGGR